MLPRSSRCLQDALEISFDRYCRREGRDAGMKLRVPMQTRDCMWRCAGMHMLEAVPVAHRIETR